MEKAVLKTLIYADIFDCPLTIREIHKWLIGKKLNLTQVEKTLEKLLKNKKIIVKKDYYFLPGQEKLVNKKIAKLKESSKHLMKAKLIGKALKIIPWIKLVGISGGLAMDNAGKKDDIDLFIITSKNSLWMSRLLALGIIESFGQRRKAGDNLKQAAGKICLNTILEEDQLEQQNKDLYVAHEVLQMKVLWEREGIYSKYLLDNEWTFKFLPNWISDGRGPASSQPHRASSHALRLRAGAPRSLSPLDLLEIAAKKSQLWIMKKPKGNERIEKGGLYFHPNDYRGKIISEYRKRLKLLHISS